MSEPSLRWTVIAASWAVSIAMRHTRRTSAMDRMLASESGLHQTSPKFVTAPIFVDVCVPPLVQTRRVRGLRRMLVKSLLSLKTEQADWLSRSIHADGMRLGPVWARTISGSACQKSKIAHAVFSFFNLEELHSVGSLMTFGALTRKVSKHVAVETFSATVRGAVCTNYQGLLKKRVRSDVFVLCAASVSLAGRMGLVCKEECKSLG
jgi:hypothetical protein